MASSGTFSSTAGMGPIAYSNTMAADKGLSSQVSALEQINRFFGRDEHEPRLNAYQNRAVIDQTLGDQMGDPQYTLDVGMTIKNLVRMNAEAPWFTVILPLQNTNKQIITGTVWKWNKRLPTPTPYHAPSNFVSEEMESFSGKIQRYGEALRMESDYFHTPEGQQNFFLKLTGIASDMVEGIRYDVMRALQSAIMEKKRYYFNQSYVDDPLKHIGIRVSLTGAMNKQPNNDQYNVLGLIMERLERVLNDATGGGPYEMIVPMEWGIYMHKVNMSPAAQPYYMYGDTGGQVFIQNGPTPKGIIGRNRFWEYDDVIVETGAKPLRMLERAISVCEYYISEFTDRDVDLFRKLTSLIGAGVDIGRSRNIVLYSATQDKYVEISVKDMVEHSSIVPTSATMQAYREIKAKYGKLKGREALLTKFYPNGNLDRDQAPNVMKNREAPHFQFYEDKYKTFHRVKYSGETDTNVTESKDHRQQGQMLCAKLATSFSLDRIGAHYANAFSIRNELQMARDSREYWIAFLEANLAASLVRTANNGIVFAGDLLIDQEDYGAFWQRWGARRTDGFPVLSTQPSGGYIIPAMQASWRSEGLTAPPGCDCAIGILSIAAMPTANGWGKYYEAIRDHKDALMNMVQCAQMIPEGEATNPLNRSPFVVNPETGALDTFYTSCVSQFRAPLFLGGYNIQIAGGAPDNVGYVLLNPRAPTAGGVSGYDLVTLSLGDDASGADTGMGPGFDTLEEAEFTTYNAALEGDARKLPKDFEYVGAVTGAGLTAGAVPPPPYGADLTDQGDVDFIDEIRAGARLGRSTRFRVYDTDISVLAEADIRAQLADQGIAADGALDRAGLLTAYPGVRLTGNRIAPAGYFPTGLVFTKGMERSRTFAEEAPICLPGDPAKHYYEPIPVVTDPKHGAAVASLKSLGVTDINGRAMKDWATGSPKHFGHFTWNQMHGRAMGLSAKGNLPNKSIIVRNLKNVDRADIYNTMKQASLKTAGLRRGGETDYAMGGGDDEDAYHSDGEGSGNSARSGGYGSDGDDGYPDQEELIGEDIGQEEMAPPPARRRSSRRRGGITALASTEEEDAVDNADSGASASSSTRRTRRRRRARRSSKAIGAPIRPPKSSYFDGGDTGRDPFAAPARSTGASSGENRHMFGAVDDNLVGSTYSRTVRKDRRGKQSSARGVESMREGYKMIYRFNGSNFVSKMRDLTTRPNDACCAMSIAAMMGRQDRVSDWKTMVTNGLHLPINFLLQRIVELFAESAILCKAGLGMTIVNNPDFKTGETVATKTFQSHLTVHYGAMVVQKDWLMMIEDPRIVGYIGGKGCEFLDNRQQLINGATHGKGNYRPSIICYAVPIATGTYYPILSLSGRWEFDDVRPENMPTDGALIPGMDWYEAIWQWHHAIHKDRIGRYHWRRARYVWPRTSHEGWHMAFNLNKGSFGVKCRGKGHLAGSDYEGAIKCLQGEVPFWEYPGDPDFF